MHDSKTIWSDINPTRKCRAIILCWERFFDVFFDLSPNNGWVNNHEAGDLRRYRAHYDVNVMIVGYMIKNIHREITTLIPRHR